MDPVIKLPGSALGKGKEVWSKAMEKSNIEMHLGTGGQVGLQFDILRHGLVGVKNFPDKDGNEVEYPANGSDKTKKNWFARYLSREVRQELANAITEGSILDEDEIKN